MKKLNVFLFALVALSTVLGTEIAAQEAPKVIVPRQKASPMAMAAFLSENNTYLKVTYGQPFKKERQIFGNLVPYGQIWRTGANEATEFTTTRDIKIDKKTLPAGTYTVFSIPEEDSWTVIFNAALGQWGAYKYDEFKDKDVLRVSLPVERSADIYEAFTMMFEETRKGADLVLVWDQTKIILPITFEN
ncbi:MAG: DUF2911 domain-containing protein [Microscillaceae bacterium]